MTHPSHGVQVFVATGPEDFRKGHDGLAALVQSHLQKKPFDGAVYIFRVRRVDLLKMIWWGCTGLMMANKRLEQNALQWPDRYPQSLATAAYLHPNRIAA